MFATIKTILDILATCLKLKPFFSACKNNVFFSTKIIICICVIMGAMIYNISRISKLNNSMPAKYAKKTSEIQKIVESQLSECGNGRAVSVSVVENSDKPLYPHKGRFIVAMATNTSLVNLLIARPTFYGKEFDIDENSYNELLKSVKQTTFYPLRIGDKQDYSSLEIYHSIYKILDGTEWSKLEKLDQLHIRSTVGYSLEGRQIVYIITFIVTADASRCNTIPDQILTSIINVIKE